MTNYQKKKKRASDLLTKGCKGSPPKSLEDLVNEKRYLYMSPERNASLTHSLWGLLDNEVSGAEKTPLLH